MAPKKPIDPVAAAFTEALVKQKVAERLSDHLSEGRQWWNETVLQRIISGEVSAQNLKGAVETLCPAQKPIVDKKERQKQEAVASDRMTAVTYLVGAKMTQDDKLIEHARTYMAEFMELYEGVKPEVAMARTIEWEKGQLAQVIAEFSFTGKLKSQSEEPFGPGVKR